MENFIYLQATDDLKEMWIDIDSIRCVTCHGEKLQIFFRCINTEVLNITEPSHTEAIIAALNERRMYPG